MRSVIVLACAVLALAPVLPASADHGCNGTVIAVSLGSEAIYLDDRSDEAGEINHWVYLESNELEGLQSGGHNAILEDGTIPSFTDPCAHSYPDTLII